MYDYGLSTLEQYELSAARFSRIRGALLCQTEKGAVIVKEYRGSQKKLLEQQKLLKKLTDEGFLVDLYLENKEGDIVSFDKDGIPYTLQHWREGKECDTRSETEVIQSISHLAKLHNAMKMELIEDYEEVSLQDEFLRHNRELSKIRKFIRKKGPVTSFEKDFFYSAEWFLEKAEQALDMLENSSYESIRREAFSNGCICHGEYNQHNVWMTGKGIAVTGFGRWKYDLQITDLYHFLRKMMEKHNWNVGMARRILAAYHHIRPITKGEWENLKIRFSYPEKYWKLANYYYTHNKAWISEKNTEKMKTVIRQKEQWAEFIERCFDDDFFL